MHALLPGRRDQAGEADDQWRPALARRYARLRAVFHKLYGCKSCLMVCPLNSRGIFGENFKLAAKVLVKTKDAKGMLKLIEEKNDMRYEDFGEGRTSK